MKYTDEKIQQIRHEAKQKQPVDFAKPLQIGEGEYIFRRVPLFNDRASVLLPETFVDMPAESAKLKYPMEQRPQIIKTNLKQDVNFAFNLFPQSLNESQVEEVTRSFHSIVRRMQPANRFYDRKVERAGDLTIGWFDFKSPGIDEALYTMMGFASVNNFLFHWMFNTAYRQMEDWKPVALQALLSTQDETREKTTV